MGYSPKWKVVPEELKRAEVWLGSGRMVGLACTMTATGQLQTALRRESLLGGGPWGCEAFVPILSRAAMMRELSVDMTATGGGPWPLSTAPHLTQSSLARTNVPDASRWTEHSGWTPGFSSSLFF